VLRGDGEALVRPIASTTCDIDQWIIQGEFPVDGPFAIGHECVAEVLEVGDRVGSVRRRCAMAHQLRTL
jgi:threonine dehydrogenase-like Zn-dependent dehydrogenase